jgi:alkylhydroperoxidase family enzyme
VHITAFAAHAKLDDAQIRSLAIGNAEDACWSDADRRLMRWCDALHANATIDDDLWAVVRADVDSDEAMIELLMLAGFYRTVSYLANAMRLPLEAGAARFPQG